MLDPMVTAFARETRAMCAASSPVCISIPLRSPIPSRALVSASCSSAGVDIRIGFGTRFAILGADRAAGGVGLVLKWLRILAAY